MGVRGDFTVTETDWQTFQHGSTYPVRLYQDGHWELEPETAAQAPTEVALPPDGATSFVVGGEGSPAPGQGATDSPPASGAG